MHNEGSGQKMLSFVIPCYRSENTIGSVIERIHETVKADGRFDHEIICVNDASPDNTISVLTELAENDPRITVVDLMKNFGQHAALMAGFNFVRGDIVVCLDDDGQTPPEEMFSLIDKLEEGYDLVSARYPVKKESLFRRFGSWTAAKMGEILVGKPKNIEMNSYFAVRRIVIDETIKYQNPFPNVQGLMLRVTRKITDVEIEHRERLSGSSGYTIKKLVSLWMNSFTSFSEKPLRISSILGFLSALAGLIFGAVVVIRKILHPEILLGYSSVMAVILVLFGIVLLMLGLIGEYIGRMYICINKAPQFAVRSVMNCRGFEGTDSSQQNEEVSGRRADA